MKKSVLSLLLVVVLVLGLLSGCKDTKSGKYEIRTAEELCSVVNDPSGSYTLVNDLDMTGVDWVPIADFAGTFNGNGKKISNLTIQKTAPGASNMGLFGNVTESATVKDLSLEAVTVHATDTDAKNVGTFAGIVAGDLVNVSATGVIYDNKEASAEAPISVGCLAGKASGKAHIKGAEKLLIADDAMVYATDSVCADVKLFVADSEFVQRGLVGVAEQGTTISGQWRDSFYSSQRQSETLQARQKTVVDYMFKMGTQPWTVPSTITHYGTADKEKMYTHIHTQKFEPGKTYYGIPYCHTSGSYERFMYCLDENGQMKDWVMAMGDGIWTGLAKDLGFNNYIGNDCSGAVAWAWMQVSPNSVKDDGSYVFLTEGMIPNTKNQKNYGVYAVGSWNGEKFTEKDATYKVMTLTESPEIFKANGMEAMMEAYAQTRKADALVYGEPGGHVRLVAEDPVVIRNADGTIDIDRSYFICHEQGDGLYNNRYKGTNSSWRINYRYTFSVMAKGSSKNGEEKYLEGGSGHSYLPITIRALRQEEMPAVTVTAEGDLLTGLVRSNYRIQSTAITVKDSTGKVVYDHQAFTGVTDNYPDNRDSITAVMYNKDHGKVMEGAAPGTYTYTVKVLLSNGEIHTPVENAIYEHK